MYIHQYNHHQFNLVNIGTTIINQFVLVRNNYNSYCGSQMEKSYCSFGPRLHDYCFCFIPGEAGTPL